MMKTFAAAALFALSSLSLAGCGFTPLYSDADGLESGSIQISEIEGYAGHAMRKELLMQLRPGVPGIESGRLEVFYDERVRDFDIRPSGLTSRTRVTLRGTYILTTPDGVISNDLETSANLAPSRLPYADITARREAQTKAAMLMATRIAEDLQLKAADPDAYRDGRPRIR
tara:strand:- start:314 stop:826 length:513 start_codon:yes stop_codon:yes gene_type:complete